MVGGVFVVAVVAAAGSLVVRFRRARGTERQQLRLLAFAAALVPAAALVALAATLAGRPAVVRFAAGTVSWLVPLALGQRLDSLTVELLAVVEDTMQPTQASLWLRPQPSSGMAGAVVAPQRG